MKHREDEHGHGPEHEQLLMDIACGEVDREAPTVHRRLEACAECRTELAEQDRLAAQLGDWAEVEREVQRIVDSGSPVPGRDLVAPFVRERMAELRAASGRERSPQRWVPAAAAAALLVTGATYWSIVRTDSRRPERPSQVRLGSEIRFEPRYEDGRLVFLSWKAELPRLGEYVLTLVSTEDGATLPLPPARLTVDEWSPDDDLQARLGSTFAVRLEVLDAMGQTVAVDTFHPEP